MKTQLRLALLLTLAPSFLLAVPSAPAEGKEVKLQLTPDSTREQVIAMLKAQGVPTTDAQVDDVMAQLAAAKNGGKAPAPAPAAPVKGKEVKLQLPPDSTREQVIAYLNAQGVGATEAQLDGIMAKLAAAKKDGKTPAPETGKGKGLQLSMDSTREQVIAELKANGYPATDAKVDEVIAQLAAAKKAGTATNVNPDPTEATDSAASVALRKYLRSDFLGTDLEYDSTANFYFTKGKVNGIPSRFQLDSGASHSHLSAESAKKFGYVLKEDSAAVGTGIGGAAKTYTTEVQSMNIGPYLKFPAQKMIASPMGGAAESDGLIGVDILGETHTVLDYRTHRMMVPKPDSKPDLSAKARECGMQEITLVRTMGYSILEGKVGGEPVRLLVDTGAQQTVLDSTSAKRLGVVAVPINALAKGIGESTMKLDIGTLGDVAIGKLHLVRMPVMLMSLAHIPMGDLGKIDGILGADFLFASDAVFDVGASKMYVKSGDIDVRNFTRTGGELFASDDELKKAWDAATRVISGTVGGYKVLPEIKTDSAGRPCRIVEISVVVGETLKGAASVEKTEIVRVTVPLHENQQAHVGGIFSRNARKIIFLPATSSGGIPPMLSSTVWTDGELAGTQLKRIR